MVRPLEEPMHPWHARRGGSGVDEAGGRLRRPVSRCATGLHDHVLRECAVAAERFPA